jgi:hypothetical protein
VSQCAWAKPERLVRVLSTARVLYLPTWPKRQDWLCDKPARNNNTLSFPVVTRTAFL